MTKKDIIIKDMVDRRIKSLGLRIKDSNYYIKNLSKEKDLLEKKLIYNKKILEQFKQELKELK